MYLHVVNWGALKITLWTGACWRDKEWLQQHATHTCRVARRPACRGMAIAEAHLAARFNKEGFALLNLQSIKTRAKQCRMINIRHAIYNIVQNRVQVSMRKSGFCALEYFLHSSLTFPLPIPAEAF